MSGLLPNALYHVTLVATNSAGSTRGGDQTFTTTTAPAPPPPTLGKTANLTPISGLVLVKPPPGKSLYATSLSATSPVPTKGQGFIPLTQARQVPAGSQMTRCAAPCGSSWPAASITSPRPPA